MLDELAHFRSLFGESPIKCTNAAYFKWKLADNPFGEGYVFLERQNGQAVGSVTLTPKVVMTFGAKVPAAQLGDGYTHPDYRRQGIFSRGEKACIDRARFQGTDLIYGDTVPQALSAEKKLGMEECRHVNVRKLFKTLSVARVEEAISRRVHATVAAKALARLFVGWDRWRSRRHAPRCPSSVVFIDEFPDRLDGAWGHPRGDYAFFTYRDSVYLNWRYAANPDQYSKLMAVDGEVYKGYMVAKSYSDNDKSVGVLCDFATLRDDLDVFSQLLVTAERAFLDSGVDYVHTLCSRISPYYRALRRLGYRDRGALTVIVYAGNEIGKEVAQSRAKWHFTLGDSDNI